MAGEGRRLWACRARAPSRASCSLPQGMLTRGQAPRTQVCCPPGKGVLPRRGPVLEGAQPSCLRPLSSASPHAAL